MELKYATNRANRELVGFNRTFMELKYPTNRFATLFYSF